IRDGHVTGVQTCALPICVVYRIFLGEQFDAMYDEFRRGGLEDSPLPSRDYLRAVAAAGQQYIKRPMISLRFYGFNTRIKPLDDRDRKSTRLNSSHVAISY